MFSKIAMAGVAAALVLGSAVAASAEDYDEVLRNSGLAVATNGVPAPYTQYKVNGYEARAQATHSRQQSTRNSSEMNATSQQQNNWPGQW